MKQTPDQPVLFLDYDGVLHPSAAFRTKHGIELRAEGTLFESAPILVELLAPHAEMQLILSTSWVPALRFSNARKRLPAALQERVVGATWHSSMDYQRWEGLSRYLQIVQTVGRRGIAHWIAIDDNAEGWPDIAWHRLVYTDGRVGLRAPAAQQELAQKLAWLCAQAAHGSD